LRLVLTEPNPKLPGTQPFLFHESKSNLDKRGRASSPTILLLVAKVLRPVNSMGRSARTAWLYRCGCDALWCGCCWEQNLEIVVGVFGLRAGPADVWCICHKKMNFSLNLHFSQDDCSSLYPPPTKCALSRGSKSSVLSHQPYNSRKE